MCLCLCVCGEGAFGCGHCAKCIRTTLWAFLPTVYIRWCCSIIIIIIRNSPRFWTYARRNAHKNHHRPINGMTVTRNGIMKLPFHTDRNMFIERCVCLGLSVCLYGNDFVGKHINFWWPFTSSSRSRSHPHTNSIYAMPSKNCDIYLFWCVKLFVDIRRRLSVDKLSKFHLARTSAVEPTLRPFDSLLDRYEREAIFAFHIHNWTN